MVQVTDRLERLVAADAGCCGDSLEACEARLEDLSRTVDVEGHDADIAALSALASETRYAIVRLLHAAGDELCVCELDALLGVSDSAISHALRGLREAGLVEGRKEGRWRYYRATPRATALLVALDGTSGGR
jgi:DNA-binding transcriptional ArsR family regulator